MHLYEERPRQRGTELPLDDAVQGRHIERPDLENGDTTVRRTIVEARRSAWCRVPTGARRGGRPIRCGAVARRTRSHRPRPRRATGRRRRPRAPDACLRAREVRSGAQRPRRARQGADLRPPRGRAPATRHAVAPEAASRERHRARDREGRRDRRRIDRSHSRPAAPAARECRARPRSTHRPTRASSSPCPPHPRARARRRPRTRSRRSRAMPRALRPAPRPQPCPDRTPVHEPFQRGPRIRDTRQWASRSSASPRSSGCRATTAAGARSRASRTR